MFVSENEFRHGKDSTVNYNAAIFRKKLGESIFLILFSEDNEARLFNRYFHLPLEEPFSSSSNYELGLVPKLLPLLTFLSLMKSLKR
ncbi:hypothetical protein BpHYR1_003104 [Brachionus plicatilis]|uniref:Uncharacterized protein n=1 Tax=Brachionus plicatilis TaxID=10195 RepID=A0A3M7SK42_BRAPC|nr:hypothetical protein BpHYR1_003104 [Brachionus plicatilis]